MKITRRKMLQGLAAAPVVVAGSALFGSGVQTRRDTDKEKPISTSSPHRSNGPKYLNVILLMAVHHSCTNWMKRQTSRSGYRRPIMSMSGEIEERTTILG